jgi:hypothetical protein
LKTAEPLPEGVSVDELIARIEAIVKEDPVRTCSSSQTNCVELVTFLEVGWFCQNRRLLIQYTCANISDVLPTNSRPPDLCGDSLSVRAFER